LNGSFADRIEEQEETLSTEHQKTTVGEELQMLGLNIDNEVVGEL
jgi:hypothetical protein